jgi:hypothetical protein
MRKLTAILHSWFKIQTNVHDDNKIKWNTRTLMIYILPIIFPNFQEEWSEHGDTMENKLQSYVDTLS